MRLYRVSAGLVSGAALLLAAGNAFAQDPAAAPEAPAAEAPPAEAPVEATAAPAEPAPEAAPAEEAPADLEEAPAEAPAPAEEEAAAPTGLSFMLFGDAYATVSTSQPGSLSPGHFAYAGTAPATADVDGDGAVTYLDRTNENGFGLHMMGLDVGYSGENWGITTSLRFGPSVPKFYGADASIAGLGSIVQGYVTWAPTDMITLDLGQFGTPFGAEVAESWVNLNYTRGALYYSMQPFWHTGLRATFALSDAITLKALIVNDANQITLNPASSAQGALQLAIAAGDLGLYIGTLQTLGEANASNFDRFFDLVVSYAPGDATIIANADLNLDDDGGGWFGASLALGYDFAPAFGASIRGEILDPVIDAGGDEYLTGTLTLKVKPVPKVENVVLAWDNRIEAGLDGATYWADGGGAPTDAYFQSTIGLAMHTSGLF